MATKKYDIWLDSVNKDTSLEDITFREKIHVKDFQNCVHYFCLYPQKSLRKIHRSIEQRTHREPLKEIL